MLDDLVVCGLLRRDGWSVRFALPVVQEYLAGLFLAHHREREIETRFEGALTRPWAEALQFALEAHADPEPFLRRFLEREDDLFGTRVRSAGRCIASGAKASQATRNEVGRRLAVLWASSEHGGLGKQAAHILAAGFSAPLPLEVIQRLEKAEGIHNESGALLAAANDNHLTLRVLRTALEKGVLPLPDDGWRAALSPVGDEALSLVVGFARESANRRTASKVRYFLPALADAPLSEQLRSALENDRSLPPSVRVTLYELRRGPLPAEALEVAVLALRQRLFMWGIVDGGREAAAILWRLSTPEAHWRSAILDPTIEPSARCALVFTILEHRDPTHAIELLRNLEPDLETPDLRHTVLLARAAVRDEEAMLQATGELAAMSEWILLTWVSILSRYHTGPVVGEALRALRGTEHTSSFRARLLAPTIAHAMTNELEARSLGVGARLVRRVDHPVKREATELVSEWASQAATGSQVDLLSLLTQAASLGHERATRSLRERVDVILDASPLGSIQQSHPFGHSLAMAIEQLEKSKLALPLDVLVRCAIEPHSLVQTSCIRLVAERGTGPALDVLIAFIPELLPMFRSDALERAEKLALTLGVRVPLRGAAS